jgi:hypothetical protein
VKRLRGGTEYVRWIGSWGSGSRYETRTVATAVLVFWIR